MSINEIRQAARNLSEDKIIFLKKSLIALGYNSLEGFLNTRRHPSQFLTTIDIIANNDVSNLNFIDMLARNFTLKA